MASVWILPIFSIIFIAIAVAITIWTSIKLNKSTEKISISPNAPIIDMTARIKFTNGYSMGFIKRETPCKNGTVRFEVCPIDVKQGENEPKPEPQVFVVAKEFIKRFARGSDVGSRREKVLIRPRMISDLPESMREEQVGKWLAKEGQLAHLERLAIEQITAGDEALEELLSKTNRTGIAKGTIKTLAEELNMVKNAILGSSEEKDKKT